MRKLYICASVACILGPSRAFVLTRLPATHRRLPSTRTGLRLRPSPDRPAGAERVPALRSATASNVPASSVKEPPLRELGVGRTSQLRKVLELCKGSEFVRVAADEMTISAVRKMNEKNSDCCLVFKTDDPSSELAGIFTERDYVRKIMDAKRTTSQTPINEVMTEAANIISAPPDMTVGECMALLVQNKIRHVPVIDQSPSGDRTVLGVISTTDLVKTIKLDDESLAGSVPIGVVDQNIMLDVIRREREAANELAVKGGERLGTQDLVRGAFVAAGTAVLVLLLQGSWLHTHEYLSMIALFCLGYLGIILESLNEFNKAAIGLLMAVALWVIYAGTAGGATGIASASALRELGEHVSEVSEIVMFLLGAMTIVEIVDAHQGFRVVTDFIKTTSKKTLMWTIGFLAFFMSAVLDNLTCTIVMISLLRKLIPNPDVRRLFGGLVVIAANAGGAWTPIGDVTTTMLWINNHITTWPTIKDLFLPSLVSLVISTFMLTRGLNADDDEQFSQEMKRAMETNKKVELAPRGKLVFFTGLTGLLSVPVFKALTGLPPYLGMLSALGVLWVLTDTIHAGEEQEALKVPAALSKIDVSGILFFFGILLSIGALDSAGILRSLATTLQHYVPADQVVAPIIGVVSALIDNVPLVAATMGMYKDPQDSPLWQLIAYCSGTGGSLLVIGSAAGVALMGLERVDFLWYFKKISLAAFVGYVGGIAVYLLMKYGLATSVFSKVSMFLYGLL